MHANYASNNRKRDDVKIIRIALDLHDVIVDSKKVVLIEYKLPLLSGLCKVRTGWRRMADGGWRMIKCG